MTPDATCGTFRASVTDGNDLEIVGGGAAYPVEIDRDDVDDLFEVFRLLAAGTVAENQSFRLERTGVGGLVLVRRVRGAWRQIFTLPRAEADDLCAVIAEIMP